MGYYFSWRGREEGCTTPLQRFPLSQKWQKINISSNNKFVAYMYTGGNKVDTYHNWDNYDCFSRSEFCHLSSYGKSFPCGRPTFCMMAAGLGVPRHNVFTKLAICTPPSRNVWIRNSQWIDDINNSLICSLDFILAILLCDSVYAALLCTSEYVRQWD